MIFCILAFIVIIFLLSLLFLGTFKAPLPINIGYGFMLFAYLNELAIHWKFSLTWTGL